MLASTGSHGSLRKSQTKHSVFGGASSMLFVSYEHICIPGKQGRRKKGREGKRKRKNKRIKTIPINLAQTTFPSKGASALAEVGFPSLSTMRRAHVLHGTSAQTMVGLSSRSFSTAWTCCRSRSWRLKLAGCDGCCGCCPPDPPDPPLDVGFIIFFFFFLSDLA